MTNTLFEIASSDIRCTLCDAGASIVSVRVRDGKGAFVEVALPCKSFHTGKPSPSSAGRTIGPCCGRIRDGEALIDGERFQLTRNEGPNHLHGGMNGCASARWTVEAQSSTRVRFRLDLPDGLDGYPGNRMLFAEYTVDQSALRVVYSATTDAPTWLDMTNHVYWDLGGRFDGSAMDQTLEIAAARVVFNDGAHLPTAIVPVDDAFDFSTPCALLQKLREHPGHVQLKNARGFNNAYILEPSLRESMGYSARLCSPHSGIRMTMTTNQPAIVLYSGGFLNANTELTVSPGVASPGCAIALEAQALPDAFHLPDVKADLLRPGEVYRREISWSFER